MTPINWMITTSDANQGGGETYRVGVTGHHKTRRGFLRPCTPHHNANVAMLNAKKTANAAMRCDVIRDANPDNRFCGCVRNIAPENKNCQRAKKFPLSGMYKIKAIEQKILSAKLKKISINQAVKNTEKRYKKAPQILFFLSDTMSYCIF